MTTVPHTLAERDALVGRLQEFFDSTELPKLLASGAHLNEHALIHDFEVVGFYLTSADAYEAAIKAFGLDDAFCIARVAALRVVPDNLTWDFALL